GDPRLGENAGGVFGLSRRSLAANFSGARRPGTLCLAAQGPQQRYPSQPAFALDGRRPGGPTLGVSNTDTGNRLAHRRHATRRAATLDSQTAPRSHYHARVSSFVAHLAGTGNASVRDALHRGRDSCAVSEQARRVSRSSVGTIAGSDAARVRAHRVIGDATAAGGNGSFPGRQ